MTRVLVVAKDVGLGTTITNELEIAGHEVMWCAGPKNPDFVCAAGKPGRCPFSLETDVVIVDGWLASDEHRAGISSWHLIRYYRDLGLPVVALIGPNGLPPGNPDPGLIAVPRRDDPALVMAAVEELSSRELSVVGVGRTGES